ncbi:hypothetical protein CYMTET_48509 [Cymbomonas tetramitiformis]|uniref:tRNA (cytosine(38)-C(5))-methyltransferase n=1 Tax=Cymbomonas tetramitiformis TaxID=36881 RepID=A0AAE0BS44_9CHLO|nr:hypothetical protein CYMTET_48509 [Cymbomonas tetramitiformis]
MSSNQQVLDRFKPVQMEEPHPARLGECIDTSATAVPSLLVPPHLEKSVTKDLKRIDWNISAHGLVLLEPEAPRKSTRAIQVKERAAASLSAFSALSSTRSNSLTPSEELSVASSQSSVDLWLDDEGEASLLFESTSAGFSPDSDSPVSIGGETDTNKLECEVLAAEVPSTLAQLLRAGDIVWDAHFQLHKYIIRGGAVEGRSSAVASCEGCHSLATAFSPAFRYIELFSGIGGFRLALDALNGRSVFSSEVLRYAIQVYQQNFGGVPPHGDIRHVGVLSVPPHDLLTAGFPCQPFTGGVDAPRRAFRDPRGQLFWHVVRIATHHHPKAMLLENVPGLLTCENGLVFSAVCRALCEAGYDVHHQVVNSSLLVPQYRARVYIVAIRKDITSASTTPFSFPPIPDEHPTVAGILQEDCGKYTLTERQWERVCGSPYFKEHPGSKLVQLDGISSTIRASYHSGYYAHSQFVAQEPSEENGGRPRFFTPRECARLQGFPDHFQLDGIDESMQYTCVGNAVSPPVITAIAHALLLFLGYPEDALKLSRMAT